MAMTQAQKSLVTMLVLIAAAAGVGAFAYYGVYKGEEAEEKKQETNAKIFDFDKSKVKSMSLLTKGGPVTVERTADNWQLTAPVTARSDKGAIDAIVDKMADLKAKNLNAAAKESEHAAPAYVVAEGAAELPKFGLDHPTWSATLTMDDGKQLSLEIGSENPYDKSLYFRRGDQEKVYLGDSGLKFPFDKTVFDLRDKSIIVQDDKDVMGFAAAGNGQAWSAERDAEGWKLTAPVQDKGDKSTIESVLTRVRTTRAKSFVVESVPDMAAAAKWGLDKPAIVLIFTMGADKTKKELDFGQVGEGQSLKMYAHLATGGPVAEVDPSIFKDIFKPVSELRDRTIVSFDRDKVTKIEVATAGGEKFTVNHTKETAPGATHATDKFTIEGRPDNLKTWKLTSALYTLGNLKGASVVAEDGSDAGKYGLDNPQWTYTIYGEGGAELAKIIIGAQNGTRFYIQKVGSPRVFDVEKSVVDAFPKTTEELLDAATPGAAAAKPEGKKPEPPAKNGK
jgi:hypothetical protein